MADITVRQFRILSDHMEVYQFMLDVFSLDWRNGVPAPFLEYALSSSWMSKDYTHRNRLWYDGEKIVAFCFTENPVTDIYFNLRPGYEALAPEMVLYAKEHMPNFNDRQQLILFKGQNALMEAAAQAGYHQKGGDDHVDMLFDCTKTLDYQLPEGYRFSKPGEVTAEQIAQCCWKGFNHEAEEGPWNGDGEDCLHTSFAPHATPQYGIGVYNAKGECVCYAGMWWTPQNKLAYMEPLCTVPEERHKGLASAVLSEMWRRMRPLGATYMTGGMNPFYEKIGYGKDPGIVWTYWTQDKAEQA